MNQIRQHPLLQEIDFARHSFEEALDILLGAYEEADEARTEARAAAPDTPEVAAVMSAAERRGFYLGAREMAKSSLKLANVQVRTNAEVVRLRAELERSLARERQQAAELEQVGAALNRVGSRTSRTSARPPRRSWAQVTADKETRSLRRQVRDLNGEIVVLKGSLLLALNFNHPQQIEEREAMALRDPWAGRLKIA